MSKKKKGSFSKVLKDNAKKIRIAVGEETGKLDTLLATISETLDYEAEMATKRLVTPLEPVMIVIMGIVVGGVVAAVIVPIYQSYGTIGSSSGAI